MVSGGEVQPAKSSWYQKIRRKIEKVFSPLPSGNVGVGGYSTPITKVLPSSLVSDSAKKDVATQERRSNLTSGGSSSRGGGSSSGGGSSGGSSSKPAPSAENLRADSTNQPSQQSSVTSEQELRKKAITNQKNIQLAEIYNKKLNAYAQPDRISGQYLDQTATYRPPTIQEQIKLDLAEERGSLPGAIKFVETKINEGIEKVREIPLIVTARDKFQGSMFFKKLQDLEEWEKSKRGYTPTDTSKISTSTFTTPEGVKSIFDFGAEQTLRAGEFGSNIIKNQYEKTPEVRYIKSEPSGQATGFLDIKSYQPGKDFSKTFLGSPSPISRETSKEVISNLFMFSGFSPLMRTATAQQTVQESEYFFDQTTQRFIKKSDLQKYLSSPEKTGNVINYNVKYSTKADRVNLLLKNLKNPNDPVAIKKVLDIAEQEYGKSFVKEFMKQEFSVPVATATPKYNPLQSNIRPVELKNIAYVESGVQSSQSVYAGTGQYERTNMFIPSSPKSQTGQSNVLGMDNKQETDQRTIQLIKPLTNQRTGQKSKQDTSQLTSPAQATTQLTTPIQRTGQLNTPAQAQRPQLKQDQIFDRMLRQPTRQQPPKKPTKPIIPKQSFAKRMLKLAESKPESFSVFVRRFGSDFLLKKVKTKKEGEKVLDRFISGSLAASGFLSKGDKKIKASELDLFKSSSYKESKNDPFRLVEVRSKRLSSGSEKKEIQYFKRKAKKSSKKKSRNLFGL